ncbi:BMP family lipoprotein [Primorskyibacter marinus]|uniref:BMP family lipoprotein n=1 Tax=Primorskyibacter marinus TaxID=1977320 RepID=UPI000E3094BD|nr:BMP family protein [Primorskyibacter marinus]
MKKRKFLSIAGASAIALSSVFVSAQTAAADDPTDLNIAIILSAGIESPWDGTLIDSLERVKAEKPHGLDMNWQYTDPLWGDDAGEAMRLFAESGEFDVIWAHSTYSDQVKKLKDEFPDILFVVVGSGNEGLGGNQYWVYKRIHEASYVLGVMAGKLTESNTLGVVGTFPADDVNDEINSFFAGARSVNENIVQKVAFIESWYDPGKAAEMTSAQISTGADIIFSLAANFKPCEEAEILCFANFGDQHSYSPETIVSSALAFWDPDVNWIIDEWWDKQVNGEPYDGNTDIIWRGMADGGAGIAPYQALADKVPDDVKALVDATIAEIKSGSLVVDVNVKNPVSN